MNNNEIIKALSSERYMAYGGHGCVRCKYRYHTGDERCGVKGCKIARNALDLINRQKAEIEQLQQLFVESGKEQDRLIAEIERLEKALIE